MEKVKVSKKIIIHGDFKGKYHGNEIVGKSVFTDYDIKIIEGEVENATKKEFLEYISDKSISFKANKIDNVKIQIKDDNYDSNYVFVEDLIDVTIYNIQFLNVIKEENNTFGEIIGKIFGSLEYHEVVEIVKPKVVTPKKTSHILKNSLYSGGSSLIYSSSLFFLVSKPSEKTKPIPKRINIIKIM